MAEKDQARWELSRGQAWGVGLGLAFGAAALARGVYWLYGRNGERNRKKLGRRLDQVRRSLQEREEGILALIRILSDRYPNLGKIGPELLSVLLRERANGGAEEAGTLRRRPRRRAAPSKPT